MNQFTEMMKSEYVDFFKNRGRIRTEIANITKDLDEKVEKNRENITKL